MTLDTATMLAYVASLVIGAFSHFAYARLTSKPSIPGMPSPATPGGDWLTTHPIIQGILSSLAGIAARLPSAMPSIPGMPSPATPAAPTMPTIPGFPAIAGLSPELLAALVGPMLRSPMTLSIDGHTITLGFGRCHHEARDRGARRHARGLTHAPEPPARRLRPFSWIMEDPPMHVLEINHSIERTAGKRRSPKWPKVRATHLKAHPCCAVCAGRQTNLITLCETPAHNCHLTYGHLLAWPSWNADVVADAAAWAAKIQSRPHGEAA